MLAVGEFKTCHVLKACRSSCNGHRYVCSSITARRCDSAVYAVVVYLSVWACPSATSRYCVKTAKRSITWPTPHDSPETLVFLMPKISGKFEQDHPNRAPNAGEVG